LCSQGAAGALEALPGWALPIAGGLLFATLLGLWQTSALWFFSTFGVGI
jgi:Family of unknown function (DUF6529)